MLATQPGSTHHFKCPVQSQEYGSCYLIVRFHVCCIVVWFFCCTSVYLLFRCFPLMVDVLPSVLVYTRICFL